MLRLLALICSALGLLSQGCTTGCDGVSDEPIAFLAGITNAERTEYQTSTWEGEYLSFPANRRYNLVHGLYSRPVHVNSYLGFTSFPLANGGNVSESAGNQVLIEEVTDEYIGVSNDTCQHFYLRLSASVEPDAPAPVAEGGAAGSGTP